MLVYEVWWWFGPLIKSYSKVFAVSEHVGMAKPQSIASHHKKGVVTYTHGQTYHKLSVYYNRQTTTIFIGSQYSEFLKECKAVATWQKMASRLGHTFAYNFLIHHLICT